MNDNQNNLLESIMGLVKDEHKDDAKTLLQHAASTATTHNVGGDIMSNLLGSVFSNHASGQVGESSGGLSGIVGSLLGGGGHQQSGGGLDVGNIVGSLLGGSSDTNNAPAQTGDGNAGFSSLMGVLPSLLKMVNPSDIGKLKDLLFQFLGANK